MSPIGEVEAEAEETAAATTVATAAVNADDVCLSCGRIIVLKEMEFTFDEILF